MSPLPDDPSSGPAPAPVVLAFKNLKSGREMQVWLRCVLASRPSHAALSVAACLASSYAHWPEPYPKQETIAAQIDLPVTIVTKGVAELRRNGLLGFVRAGHVTKPPRTREGERPRKPKAQGVYRFLIPEQELLRRRDGDAKGDVDKAAAFLGNAKATGRCAPLATFLGEHAKRFHVSPETMALGEALEAAGRPDFLAGTLTEGLIGEIAIAVGDAGDLARLTLHQRRQRIGEARRWLEADRVLAGAPPCREPARAKREEPAAAETARPEVEPAAPVAGIDDLTVVGLALMIEIIAEENPFILGRPLEDGEVEEIARLWELSGDEDRRRPLVEAAIGWLTGRRRPPSGGVAGRGGPVAGDRSFNRSEEGGPVAGDRSPTPADEDLWIAGHPTENEGKNAQAEGRVTCQERQVIKGITGNRDLRIGEDGIRRRTLPAGGRGEGQAPYSAEKRQRPSSNLAGHRLPASER